MPDQTVNIPLLRKAVEWAEGEAAKPFAISEWYQGHYELNTEDELDLGLRALLGKSPDCGTCYCIAGWVSQQEIGAISPSSSIVAQQALGLTSAEARKLFGASNTITDVRRIAEDIAGERL